MSEKIIRLKEIIDEEGLRLSEFPNEFTRDLDNCSTCEAGCQSTCVESCRNGKK